jgi:sugar lactone lactonase YvrE
MKKNTFKVVVIGLLSLVMVSIGAPRTAFSQGQTETVEAATQSGNFHTPLDSTPDPNANTIYFTAIGPHGPGVFRVPAAGGEATEVVAGPPFVVPTGVAMSTDGQSLYVADPLAYSDGGRAGQIFVISMADGSVRSLSGTEGTRPQGLDVVSQNGHDVLCFTGRDPMSREAAVFKMAATGDAAPTIVASGSPLVDPDGLAVTHTGTVYVTDHSSVGKVFKLDGGAITCVVENTPLGEPAGIALTADESQLLVSALQSTVTRAQILVVDLATHQTKSITGVIGANRDAGGLHRAHNLNTFSWCGVTAGTGGMGVVYRVNF